MVHTRILNCEQAPVHTMSGALQVVGGNPMHLKMVARALQAKRTLGQGKGGHREWP
jgi:hypothetical protein